MSIIEKVYCPRCNLYNSVSKYGKTKDGRQTYWCRSCDDNGKPSRFTEKPKRKGAVTGEKKGAYKQKEYEAFCKLVRQNPKITLQKVLQRIPVSRNTADKWIKEIQKPKSIPNRHYDKLEAFEKKSVISKDDPKIKEYIKDLFPSAK